MDFTVRIVMIASLVVIVFEIVILSAVHVPTIKVSIAWFVPEVMSHAVWNLRAVIRLSCAQHSSQFVCPYSRRFAHFPVKNQFLL